MPYPISRISKSQYLKGLQCPKALWLYRHRPDLRPEISDSQQHLFDTGHEVGKLAQKYFDGGIEITEEYYEIDKAIESTERAVNDGNDIIYEATASSNDGGYSKIDILSKVKGANEWDLIEVKQSTSVKEYHIDDITFQRYAFENAGYPIRKSILTHLNNAYVRFGELDLNQLFLLEDCTREATDNLSEVPGALKNLLSVVNAPNEPNIDIGDHCKAPFECDYKHYCWQHIPEYSVYNVLSGNKRDELLSKGIIDIADIPADFPLTDRQAIDINSYKNNQVHADQNAINDFVDSLVYPLHYLDYETIFPAIPLFDNSSPFQQTPFQFSLHIQDRPGSDLKHKEFLHTGSSDPRPEFVKALIGSCGNEGSIVVYNQGFESRINNELGFALPQYKTDLENINNRMRDLLVPFRSRYLYHPNMMGSASLKSVLPAFVPELSYDNLAIGDGDTASLLYLSCIKDLVPIEEKEIIYKNLREYCGMDTMAEVRLVEVLNAYKI